MAQWKGNERINGWMGEWAKFSRTRLTKGWLSGVKWERALVCCGIIMAAGPDDNIDGEGEGTARLG